MKNVETTPHIPCKIDHYKDDQIWPDSLGYIDISLFIKSTVMKRICNSIIFRLWVVFLLSFMSMSLWAQDSTATSNKTISTETTTTTTTEWYAQTWVWIVGGAVLLIILVALLRGGGSNKDTTERSTTIIKDR
jgi:hypothetical protein